LKEGASWAGVIDVSDIHKKVKKAHKITLINLLPDIFIPPETYPFKFDKNHIIRLSFMQN